MKKLITTIFVVLLFVTQVFPQATALTPDGVVTSQTLTPTLSWTTDATVPTHYRVTVSAVTPVVGGVGDYVSLAIAHPTASDAAVAGLSTNTTYYWIVESSDDGGGTWVRTSVEATFKTVPAAPTLAAPPANAATGIATNVSLSWNAVAGGNWYVLEVNDDPTFVNATEYTTSGNILTAPAAVGLTYSTPYSWRVKASNDGGATFGAWSTSWIFTTKPPPPTIIAPSPANFAVGVSVLPQFAWTGAVGVTDYDFEISLTSGGAAIVLSPVFANGDTHDFSYVTSSSTVLANGTTYYWRVRQTTPAGLSDWSTVREFKTVIAAKPTVYYQTPGATSVYFSWNPIPYSSGLKYEVLVSAAANMTGYTTEYSGTNTYYTLPVNAVAKYVQVRATNSSGSIIISYSDISAALTAGSLPVPTASYPTNNIDDGDVYANPPTLFWYIQGNEPSLTYELELFNATDPNWDDALSGNGADNGNLMTSNKTFKKVTLSLIAGQTYTWHVRSVSGAVKSNWSATGSFKMYSNVATATIVPTPSWPVGNATVYQNPPTLYWYLGSDKTGLYYEVELSYDGIDGGAGTSFTTPIVVAGKSQDLFKALTATLEPAHTYYWHVRSDLDAVGGGESAWSTNGSFTIASTAQGGSPTPYPSWPIGGAIVDGTMANIELSWTASSAQALDYLVRMATSSSVDGTGMLNHGSAHNTAASWVPTLTTANAQTSWGSPLTAGATYYWQVRSRLNATTTVLSSWSMVASFSTAAGASSVVPLIVSPNYLQPLNNTVAVLTWNIPVQSESPLKYDLQYSKNSDFSSSVTVPNLNNPSTLVSGLEPNSTYYWRVLSKTDKGSISSYSTTGTFKTSGTTAVGEQETIPTEFELAQNYPNPFNPTTRINFSIPQNSFVNIRVYDILGREVKTLVDQQMTAGSHSVEWNAENNLGGKVSTGMYIYRITAGSFVATKKMSFIK